MNRSYGIAAALLAVAPAPLQSQAPKPKPVVQQVIAPKTVYWLSAATQAGFGLGGKPPSAGDMMRMAMGGGGGGPMKLLDLDLGSKLPPSGPPAASHAIPPAMDMGDALALRTPRPVKGTPVDRDPEQFERPKGKLLLFWGCGETARPGQPVVIDFASLAAGPVPPGLFGSERVRVARPPSSATWPTHGHWPNDDRGSQQAVPVNASLVGAHKVTGNYTPAIDFTLSQDWMPDVGLRQAKTPTGALGLSWTSVPGATAHFVQMMGGSGNDADGATMVFWSSSEAQTFVSGLSDYIAPAEAARLVDRKQLMPASQTRCSVPKEAIAASPTGLLTFVSHGPEVNIIHPPRPSDPRTPWVQEWAVKARFASRSGAIAGMDMGEMAGGSRSSSRSAKPRCQPSGSDVMGEALGGAIGGLFGGKKKPKDCEN